MLVEETFRISADTAYSAEKNHLVDDLGVRAQQPDLGEGGGAVVVLMVGVGEDVVEDLLVGELTSPRGRLTASGRRDSESRALADASGRDVVEDLLVGELVSPRGRRRAGCGGGPPRQRAREPARPPLAGVTPKHEPSGCLYLS
jgi:hypothetical protein